jgi:hypothetical protein
MQDKIQPYRYTDDQIIDSLNVALQEIQRIRPDIFLDLKYQQRVQPNDLDDGFIPAYYTVSDIAFDGSNNYDPLNGTLVPIPSRFNDPVIFYMGGHLQLLDVEDTQDQRAVAFMAKVMQRLTQPQT